MAVTEFQLLAIEESNSIDGRLNRQVQHFDTKLQGFGNQITLQPGVKLKEPGRSIEGERVKVPNKITKSEYQKL